MQTRASAYARVPCLCSRRLYFRPVMEDMDGDVMHHVRCPMTSATLSRSLKRDILFLCNRAGGGWMHARTYICTDILAMFRLVSGDTLHNSLGQIICT